MASSSSSGVELYRRLIKSAEKFKDYNMREYLTRRARDKFREALSAEGGGEEEAKREAEKELAWMERQEKVYELYASEKTSVLEKK